MHQHGLPEEAGTTRGRRESGGARGGGELIDAERPGTSEVHHIENRLDLDLTDERPFYEPSAYIRATGYLIILAIVIVIWYSAVYS
jgi:hypothetical protein